MGKKNLDLDFIHAFTKKRWFNISDRCNGKTHPDAFLYRPYRRGRNRCIICGAKLGRIRCIRDSIKNRTINALLAPHPFYSVLKERGLIKEKGTNSILKRARAC